MLFFAFEDDMPAEPQSEEDSFTCPDETTTTYHETNFENKSTSPTTPPNLRSRSTSRQIREFTTRWNVDYDHLSQTGQLRSRKKIKDE